MLILVIFSHIRLLSLVLSQKNSQVHTFVKSFYFLFPLSPQTYLFCVMVWHIKRLCYGGLILWCLVVFSVLKVLCWGWPHILVLGRIFLLCVSLCVFISLLKLPLMLAVPILFCIFANGTILSPSTLLWLWYHWTRIWLFWALGLNFITGMLEFIMLAVLVLVLVAGGIGQSFLNSKRLPDNFPVLNQGVLTQIGASSNSGGFFSEVGGFWFSGFAGTLVFAWGSFTDVLPDQVWLLLSPCTSLLGLAFLFSLLPWILF